MKSYDVIIIGAGITGSFALYQLATQGVTNCLLIDRAYASGRGATGSWGSLLRVVHKNPHTTLNAAHSLPFYWHFADKVFDQCGFNDCGSLYFLRRDQLGEMSFHIEVLKANHIPYEIIDNAQGKSAFGHFNWFENDIAIYEPHAGTACPYQATSSLINFAEERGAKSLFSEAVTEIRREGDRIIGVKTASGLSFHCQHLVVAAGQWSLALLASIGVNVDIVLKIIQINRFCKSHMQARIPLFIDRNLRAFGHFFPDASFAGGALADDKAQTSHCSSHRLDISDALTAKLTVSKRLNWLKNASLEGGIRAAETYSPDGEPFISNDFAYRNLVVATGTSCTGFTLGPMVGEKIVRLVIGAKF